MKHILQWRQYVIGIERGLYKEWRLCGILGGPFLPSSSVPSLFMASASEPKNF
jgi:formate-dependent nitrite reductase membrane component NrfD